MTPITTPSDISHYLKDKNLTRRDVLGKVAEVFDPVGIWEPFKVQLKLQMTQFKGSNWDDDLPDTQKTTWINIFSKFLNLSTLSVPRSVVPMNADIHSFRLICLSDAAATAVGAAVYASFELPNGQFHSQLLTSKSRLSTATIPRNELCGILLMSELAYVVKISSPIPIKEVIYATDSTIALSWCMNTNLKLKQFTLNRVETIRRLIAWTTANSENPW